jgi:hypothetical protein
MSSSAQTVRVRFMGSNLTRDKDNCLYSGFLLCCTGSRLETCRPPVLPTVYIFGINSEWEQARELIRYCRLRYQ